MAISAGMWMRSRLLRSKSVTSSAAVAGSEFDGGEALVEGARRQQPVEQRLRHRLSRPRVAGVVLQDLRHFQPVLVELRGQLDEIAADRGAGERRMGHVRQQAVQRMAELVE